MKKDDLVKEYWLEKGIGWIKDEEVYDEVKSICVDNSYDETEKEILLKSAFERADFEYQYKILFEDCLIDIQKENPKIQTNFLLNLHWVSFNFSSNYNRLRKIIQSHKIHETAKETFIKSVFIESIFDVIEIEERIWMLADGLIALSIEEQFKLLQEYLSRFVSNEHEEYFVDEYEEWSVLDYGAIKKIAMSNKIDETVKTTFFKSAFEKVDTECQYKMLANELITLSTEEQFLLLRECLLQNDYICSDYNEIVSISRSNKIADTVKTFFLKSAYVKVCANHQYKMLFEDCLIDIQKETSESQTDFLQKHLSELGKIEKDHSRHIRNNDWKYYDIKLITQSDRIDEIVKAIFLKSVFDKASAEYKYKILFEDCLIDIKQENIQNQKELLQKYFSEFGNISDTEIYKKIINQSKQVRETIKSLFLEFAYEKADSEYQYKMLFEDCLIDIQKETSENQVEYLQKYLLKLGKIKSNVYEYGSHRYWQYNRIKLISCSDKINEIAKTAFLKSVFKNASAEYQCKMLFIDCLVDNKQVNLEDQKELLQNYLLEIQQNNSISYEHPYVDYEDIKLIVQSNKISKETKLTFLKFAFEKTTTSDQHKIKELEEDIFNT